MITESSTIVRDTWRRLEPAGPSHIETFLRHLYTHAPASTELFAPAPPDALAAALGDLIAQLDEPRRITVSAVSIARRAARSPTDAERHMMEEALVYTLRGALGDAFTPDVREAWLEAYTLLASIEQRVRATRSRDPGTA
jgi:hemoglobin-like flavoprotein